MPVSQKKESVYAINPKEVSYGRTKRMSFAKQDELQELPNLLEVQKESFEWLFKTGFNEVFEDIGPVVDHSGKHEVRFLSFNITGDPKYTVEECKQRDATYAAPIKVRAMLYHRDPESGHGGEIAESDIYLGEFPMMTEAGTFIINGAERVIVSQIVRSPSAYFFRSLDPKIGSELFRGQLIPYRGVWIEYETDASDVLYVTIDKNRKMPASLLVRTIAKPRAEYPWSQLCVPGAENGIESEQQFLDIFGDNEFIRATLGKDERVTREESLFEIYKKIRPGEPPTADSAESLLNGYFFDHGKYDLSRVGRYKMNKKLALAPRLAGQTLAEPIVNPLTGELLEDEGAVVSRERAEELENLGVCAAAISIDGKTVKILGNGMVPITDYLDINPEEVFISEKVRFVILKKILEEFPEDKRKDAKGNIAPELKSALIRQKNELVPNTVIPDDIIASVSYIINLQLGIGAVDDIDHLGNRRLRAVGELLQNVLRIGFARMVRTINERMTMNDMESATPQSLINIRPVLAAIKEFFGSSPLSQFMDQTNPLAELTHKRRLSALGPGGLSRDRAGFDVRDVHYTHYGRMCPIETPEGPNIGLISYLASHGRVDKFGFLLAPYRPVDKKTGKVSFSSEDIVYMTASEEDAFIIAQATEPVGKDNKFVNDRVTCRHRDEIIEVDKERVDYVDLSPGMMVSVATAMIPFLENDDANRALMGANMQRQAVPLLRPQAPIVATGIEHKCAIDSTICILAEGPGTVKRVSASEITIEYDAPLNKKTYKLTKFLRSNQGTCINQRPIVSEGERVEKGDVIADGPSCENGELALGKNILVGFMTWEGYNYEDAILINERLCSEDVFSSIHIEEYECEARETKLGDEEITDDIPGIARDAVQHLTGGIINIGTEVQSGDVLVGKVTPKGETDITPEERLLRAIFGDKAREFRDTSLKVPHGEGGIIVDVRVFERSKGDEMSPGVNKVVRVYIAQKRKISVGDKMAGRHGNKGVVSRILPAEDMPYLPDGTPLDIVLNPLGVPSRMNIGQVLEVHLGYAANALGWKVATPVFNGADENDILGMLEKAGLNTNGKSTLYDGRTGDAFDNDVTVGYVYFLKLHHLVDDKIHARSTGPYSLVTQQPLGGKAQFGGQRFGEMEVWALEAYGAAYTLLEMLTVKSDDVSGRDQTYKAIVKGQNLPTPGTPESFKVLIQEFRALALNVSVLDADGNPVELKQNEEEDDFPEMLRPAIEIPFATQDEKSLAGMGLYTDNNTRLETESDAYSEAEADDGGYAEDDVSSLISDIIDN
ncbi:MAG: DNA-directed RNA polymerase subunit beta [Oscillospiraceae bacterium]|jgi:DNA-directed RNA polymerase subunit beta|nr:DNA-directed RNA polymerase subunit beta [Oscillospiraceae bacterium]